MIRLYSDAAVSGHPGHAGIGLVIIIDKEQIQLSIPLSELHWDNHRAEFIALLKGIEWLVDNESTHHLTFCYTDSQIVAQSIEKSYVKDEIFQEYLTAIQNLMDQFNFISVEWIPESANKGADNLARQALQKAKKQQG